MRPRRHFGCWSARGEIASRLREPSAAAETIVRVPRWLVAAVPLTESFHWRPERDHASNVVGRDHFKAKAHILGELVTRVMNISDRAH